MAWILFWERPVELFDGIRHGLITMPGNAWEIEGGEYASHLQALVRAVEPDDFGQPMPRYVHTRPDDFAHTEAYALVLARIFGPHNSFWD